MGGLEAAVTRRYDSPWTGTSIHQPEIMMLLRPDDYDPRTLEQRREHYEIEKELADRLRVAPARQRRELYRTVYNELFQRVPHHPQLTRKVSPEWNQAVLAPQLGLLEPFLTPDTTFLDIGAGDCTLSLEVAKRVKQVYAVDVSDEITKDLPPTSNFELRLSDGTSMPVPDGSVDVAYSNQLMEHLHPDDAFEQLRNICRTLRSGGVYICITPNRLIGPRDISKYFDEVATGFHLKEYTFGELGQVFRRAGFRRVHALVGARGRYVDVPAALVRLTETALDALPRRLGKSIALLAPFRLTLGIRIVGTK